MNTELFDINHHLAEVETKNTDIVAAVAAPPWPQSTKVSAESRDNYSLRVNNPQYGFTGLMAVNTWQTTCYGEVRPGYCWLMAGGYTGLPPFQGTLHMNCAAVPPLDPNNGTLHGQMCQLLGRPTEDFIGFSIKPSFQLPQDIGYNSWTCNDYWFGTNTLPPNWQDLVNQTMLTWLPHT